MCRRRTRRACAICSEPKSLDDLLARVIEVRDRVRARAGPTPLLLKIAPDLTLADLDDIVGVARAPQGRRHDRRATPRFAGRRRCASARSRSSRAGCPAGRYSRCRPGCWRKPMCAPEGAIPLIGVGGIDSGEDGGRQDQGRRQRWCSSIAGWCFTGSGWSPRSSAAVLRRGGAAPARGPGRRRCRRHHRAAMAGVTIGRRSQSHIRA